MFEDSFHAFIHRNADELRGGAIFLYHILIALSNFGSLINSLLSNLSTMSPGRLHITFAGEEGVDAGGPSREFFAILAKDMFNPNYALFMS